MNNQKLKLKLPFTLSSLPPQAFLERINNYRNQYFQHKKEDYEKQKLKQKQAKPPAKPYILLINKKGTLSIRIRNRKPKYLTSAEIQDLYDTHKGNAKVTKQVILDYCTKKKIQIRMGDTSGTPKPC